MNTPLLKRKYRFLFETGGIKLPVKVSKRPWFEGPGELVLSFIGPNQKSLEPIMNILAEIYNNNSPIKNCKIILIDGCGNHIEEWTIPEMTVYSVDLGEEIYSLAPVDSELNLKVRYETIEYKELKAINKLIIDT